MPVLFAGMDVGLPSSEVSLARVLSDAGYATQAIGKSHCGDQPDFMPEQPPLPLIVDGEVVEQQPDQASLTERYVAHALEFMRSTGDRPFFSYLAHMYVHLPIYVQQRFADASQNGAYGAAVESIDWATSVILDELDAQGIADDTIVIFTSDNGSLGNRPPPWGSSEPLGGSNDPLRGAKGSTWEGGQRVPGIVRWPARIPAGRTSDEVVTTMDLYPTLAAIGGAEVPTDRVIDGRNISALWFDDAPSPHDAFFYFRMNDLEAVRAGSWKLHFSKRGAERRELYDLVDDIGETTDVIADHPDVVARLEALAQTARTTLGDERLGRIGGEVRPIGRVDNAVPLTVFDPDHPHVIAEYDIADRG